MESVAPRWDSAIMLHPDAANALQGAICVSSARKHVGLSGGVTSRAGIPAMKVTNLPNLPNVAKTAKVAKVLGTGSSLATAAQRRALFSEGP